MPPRVDGMANNAAAAAVCGLLDGGMLRLYAGPRPPRVGIPIEAENLLLAQLRFNEPAFKPPRNGIAEARMIEDEPSARATGTATWFLAISRDGHPICDGLVGEEDGDLVLNSTAIEQGGRVTVTSFRYIQRIE